MREDFAKVVHERPRTGMKYKTPKGSRRSNKLDENAPKREKIRQKWVSHDDGRRTSILYGPIRRFLQSQVGKNWNTVYSEIKKRIPDIGDYLYGYIEHFVEREVIMVGKKPHYNDGILYGYAIYNDVCRFYVNPLTRKLCKAPDRPYKLRTHDKITDVIDISKDKLAKKIDGIWYLLTTKPYNPEDYIQRCTVKIGKIAFPTTSYKPHYDMAHKKELKGRLEVQRLYGRLVIPITKEQLNKRELKKYGCT